jgi:hypothetical protein
MRVASPGRPLRRGEVVHHEDENKLNYDPRPAERNRMLKFVTKPTAAPASVNVMLYGPP